MWYNVILAELQQYSAQEQSKIKANADIQFQNFYLAVSNMVYISNSMPSVELQSASNAKLTQHNF